MYVGQRLARGVDDYDLMVGSVGKGAATEFTAFLKLAQDAPSLDEIILSPKSTRIPEDASLKFLVATGLAARAKKENFVRIHEYLLRMPMPFRVLCMRDTVQRDKELAKTETFVRWSLKEGQGLI